MMMEMFVNRFPDVGEKETRCVIMPPGKDLPEGHYYFAESFCNDKKCDCRRAFINVIYEDNPIATIGFGWEDIKFYEKWAHDKSMAPDLKGPILELTGIRTKHSKNALKLFEEVMMHDTIFIERLKKHYKMFKEILSDNEEDEVEDFNPDEHTVASLCKDTGTGVDAISDKNREAFYPIIMAIEETIWSYYLENDSLKDSEVIELLKNLRDNILTEKASFNRVEEEIIRKIKLVLFLNSYDKRDLSLSISAVLKSAKLHRSMGGNRGYLTFISHFLNQMKK
ncbi:TPA: hypothetical protein HA361_01215 [Candidatus Woesearchaeota archaeon]|nr:hypothetical protein [Candidatus Woesearchaeota archaeon]